MHKILRWRPVKAHTLTPASGCRARPVATDLPPPLTAGHRAQLTWEAGAETRHGPRVTREETAGTITHTDAADLQSREITADTGDEDMRVISERRVGH